MTKILQIFTYNKNTIGGISVMVDSYMNGTKEFSANGIELGLLNIEPSFNTKFSPINNVVYIFSQQNAVKKHLKTHNYDAIHIHTSREFLFLKDVLLARLIKKKFNIPIVMTIHVGAMETVYNRITWFKKVSISIINKYVDKIIFLSKIMRSEFTDKGINESKSTVLYNFHNLTPSNAILERKKEQLQVLFVGMLNRDKGIIELMKALSKLTSLDFHLNVCGKLVDNSIKEELDYYRNILGEKISFLGCVGGKEKTDIFNQSDILVLPSYHEGLPIVIMESLAAGCAIVSTKVGAIPEILTDDNCYWVRKASIEDIVDVFKTLNFKKMETMKLSNKNLGDSFSFNEHVKKLSYIYHSIIKDEVKKYYI